MSGMEIWGVGRELSTIIYEVESTITLKWDATPELPPHLPPLPTVDIQNPGIF